MATPEAQRYKSSDSESMKSIASLPQNCYNVRENQEHKSINETFSPSIPTIDFKNLIHESEATTQLEQHNLHLACKDWGFFQLVNHGVSEEVLKKLRQEIEEFFKLPFEEKMKYKPEPGDVDGYRALIREDKKLDWGDGLYLLINPVHRRKSHIFPHLPSELRTILETYVVEMENLAITLVGILGKTMKVEQREIKEMFKNGMQGMRMTYYPPCPEPELALGLNAHSDACGITILNQVNDVDGLQIKKDGLWIPVNVSPHTLIVNIGDVLEIMSNGLYKSVEHRATVSSEKERFSMAMFFNPKYECEIGPSTKLIDKENPPIYKKIGMEKYLKDYFTHNKLDGKSFLEQMKITNENDGNATIF